VPEGLLNQNLVLGVLLLPEHFLFAPVDFLGLFLLEVALGLLEELSHLESLSESGSHQLVGQLLFADADAVLPALAILSKNNLTLACLMSLSHLKVA
jgi:hypothetical protein